MGINDDLGSNQICLSPSGKAVQLAYQDPLLNNIKTGAAAWSVQLSTELINDRQVYPAG